MALPSPPPTITTGRACTPVRAYTITLCDAGTCVKDLCVMITQRHLTIVWPIAPECALLYRLGQRVPATLEEVDVRLQMCNPYLDEKAWAFGGTLRALFVHLDRLLRSNESDGGEPLRNGVVINVQKMREELVATTSRGQAEAETETETETETEANRSAAMVDLTGDEV